MKTQTSIIILIAFLTSCKSWDPSMIKSPESPISPKLLTLERKIEDLANTTIKTSDHELKLFTEEVENNLIDPYGDKYGYIALKRNIVQSKMGIGLYILSAITATVPNLLGMPFMNIRYKVEVELRVMDSQNRLIGKYSSLGESKVKVAYYYGYSMGDAFQKAYPDALNDAFSKIRPQIQKDVERLNRDLMKAGKL